MKLNLIVLAAALTGAVLPIAAQAQSDTLQVSRPVAYRDLDLTSSEGRARLDQRLAAAVRQVCGPLNSRELSQAASIRACRRQATALAGSGRDLAMAASTKRRADMAVMTVATPLAGK